MNNQLSIFSLIVFLCVACGPQEGQKDKTDLYEGDAIVEVEQDANDLLMEEVMQIHDEVMPEMGNIRNTRKAILDKIETSSDEELHKVLQVQADNLDASFEAMMVWMRQFNPNQDSTTSDSTYHAYLLDQKEKMIEVRDLMVNSLKERKAILGEN